MAEEKDDWLDDLEGTEEKVSELGQSDIDALLSGPDESSPSPGDGEELGQADIDALLSGDDDFGALAPQGGAGDGDLDQSDIEALLSSSDAPAQDQPFPDPDQDEIDKLFSEPESEGAAESPQPFPAEDIDFGDAFDTAEASPSQSPFPSDFDHQDFKLEVDIPDIPDSSDGPSGDKSFLDEETVAIPVESTAATVLAGAAVDSVQSPQEKIRKLFVNRKRIFAVGAGLTILVLLSAGLYFFKSEEGAPQKEAGKEAPAAEVAHENILEQQTEPPPANTGTEHLVPEVPSPAPSAPVSDSARQEQGASEASHVAGGAPMLPDLTLVMPEGSNELAITLEGKDPENLPLEYEFQTMPLHGQILGHAPHLVYSARADFSGQDSFTLRATNGKNFSPVAKVTIHRQIPISVVEPLVPVAPSVEPLEVVPPPPPSPPSVTAAASTPQSSTTKKEGISARNVSYTTSTSLVIPWEKIWRKVNTQPYSREVGVEILQPPRHGTLEVQNGRQSAYKPNPSFSGKDTIQYRFTLGEIKSALKSVTISVLSKNRSPELHIEPYSAFYSAGDMVFLSAVQTKDEARDTVQFRWEQISGVPVVIKSLNGEGSQVAFVAPATFNTVSNPGVGFRVTATDEHGWGVSREVYVRTQSRRNSAIWR